MSKFSIGDRVRVKQLTDLDAELTDMDRVITTTARARELFGPIGPGIGDVGVVNEVWFNDYYSVSVQFNDGEPATYYSFIDDDLELVED